MSSTNDRHKQRIDFLEGRVTGDYLECIKSTDGSTTTEESSGEDLVEALQHYDARTLDDVDEIKAELQRLDEKLTVLGDALPRARRLEVEQRHPAILGGQALQYRSAALIRESIIEFVRGEWGIGVGGTHLVHTMVAE